MTNAHPYSINIPAELRVPALWSGTYSNVDSDEHRALDNVAESAKKAVVTRLAAAERTSPRAVSKCAAQHLAARWDGPSPYCNDHDPAQQQRTCVLCETPQPTSSPQHTDTYVCDSCLPNAVAPQLPAADNVLSNVAAGWQWVNCEGCGDGTTVLRGETPVDRELITCTDCDPANIPTHTCLSCAQPLPATDGHLCQTCDPTGPHRPCVLPWCNCHTTQPEGHRYVALRILGVVPSTIAQAAEHTTASIAHITHRIAPWRPWHATHAEQQHLANEPRWNPPSTCTICGGLTRTRTNQTCSRDCASTLRTLKQFRRRTHPWDHYPTIATVAQQLWDHTLPGLHHLPAAAALTLAYIDNGHGFGSPDSSPLSA